MERVSSPLKLSACITPGGEDGSFSSIQYQEIDSEPIEIALPRANEVTVSEKSVRQISRPRSSSAPGGPWCCAIRTCAIDQRGRAPPSAAHTSWSRRPPAASRPRGVFIITNHRPSKWSGDRRRAADRRRVQFIAAAPIAPADANLTAPIFGGRL